jgi:hypothetical protein
LPQQFKRVAIDLIKAHACRACGQSHSFRCRWLGVLRQIGAGLWRFSSQYTMSHTQYDMPRVLTAAHRCCWPTSRPIAKGLKRTPSNVRTAITPKARWSNIKIGACAVFRSESLPHNYRTNATCQNQARMFHPFHLLAACAAVNRSWSMPCRQSKKRSIATPAPAATGANLLPSNQYLGLPGSNCRVLPSS